MKKTSIYQFPQKLERYYVTCCIVTLELIYLVCSGAIKYNVIIEMIPILMTTSMPDEQNKYPSCKDFFSELLQTDVNTLDPKKVNGLHDSWPQTR